MSRLRVAPGSPYSAGTLCPQSELGWPPAHGGTLRVPPSGSQGAEVALSRCCPSLPSPSPVGCFSDKNHVSSSCCHRRGRGCRQRGSTAHCLCGDPPLFWLRDQRGLQGIQISRAVSSRWPCDIEDCPGDRRHQQPLPSLPRWWGQGSALCSAPTLPIAATLLKIPVPQLLRGLPYASCPLCHPRGWGQSGEGAALGTEVQQERPHGSHGLFLWSCWGLPRCFAAPGVGRGVPNPGTSQGIAAAPLHAERRCWCCATNELPLCWWPPALPNPASLIHSRRAACHIVNVPLTQIYSPWRGRLGPGDETFAINPELGKPCLAWGWRGTVWHWHWLLAAGRHPQTHSPPWG